MTASSSFFNPLLAFIKQNFPKILFFFMSENSSQIQIKANAPPFFLSSHPWQKSRNFFFQKKSKLYFPAKLEVEFLVFEAYQHDGDPIYLSTNKKKVIFSNLFLYLGNDDSLKIFPLSAFSLTLFFSFPFSPMTLISILIIDHNLQWTIVELKFCHGPCLKKNFAIYLSILN